MSNFTNPLKTCIGGDLIKLPKAENSVGLFSLNLVKHPIFDKKCRFSPHIILKFNIYMRPNEAHEELTIDIH